MGLYAALRPLLFRADPETAHRLTIRALRTGLVPNGGVADPPVLATRLAGLALPNPIGLAAGFDKDADLPDALLGLGFGFVEVGTVTPLPQPGNPRPRMVRLVPHAAVVNRLGFNNGGIAAAHARLAKRRRGAGIVGVNIGANKNTADRAADYAAGAAAMRDAADYLTINVSSPNTPGLRALQAVDALRPLIAAAREAAGAGGPPLFVKIAPDLTDAEVDVVAALALESGIAGVIATNTTVARPDGIGAGQEGGLSGPPLFARSTEVLRRLRRVTRGRVALIGVGGVDSAEAAYAKIRTGADAVQLYTALVYHGPGLVRRIKTGLAALLARDGFHTVAEAVGVDA